MEGGGVFSANHRGFRVLILVPLVGGVPAACVCDLLLTPMHPSDESGVEA